jgi:hypothetical protein
VWVVTELRFDIDAHPVAQDPTEELPRLTKQIRQQTSAAVTVVSEGFRIGWVFSGAPVCVLTLVQRDRTAV